MWPWRDRQQAKEGIVGARRTDRQVRGDAAEDAAAAWLVRHGLVVLARKVRFRGGELDLVCRDGTTIVFVEVRQRSSARFGGAAASITRRKQQRILLAAQLWLTGPGQAHADAPCRFDAVLFEQGARRRPTEWLRDAFRADDLI